MIVVVAAIALFSFYRFLNGYPSDHGLAALGAEGDGYTPETWVCIVDIFENHRPLPGTLFGQFVVEPVYRDSGQFDGFAVEAAFASQGFRIGDGQIYSYHYNEFYDWASLSDCSTPLSGE